MSVSGAHIFGVSPATRLITLTTDFGLRDSYVAQMKGVIARRDIRRLTTTAPPAARVGDYVAQRTVVAWPDEPLRLVAHRMAETGLTRFPVVTREKPTRLVGMIALSDLLRARAMNLDADRRREQVLPLRTVLPRALRFFRGFGRMTG